ncbi:MAG: hypothetical protein WA633_25180 [Stellaceae bacterium]
MARLDEAIEDIDWQLDELRDLLREVRKIYGIDGITRPIYLGQQSVRIGDDGKAVMITRRHGEIVDVSKVDLEPAETEITEAPNAADIGRSSRKSKK